MNKKIYKGLEIMEMISKGKIAEHQKFNFENNNFDGDVEYYNGTLYWLVYDEEWNLKDKKNLFDMFNIQSTMVADFKFVEDNTEEIEELKRTENVYDITLECYHDIEKKISNDELADKINEIIRYIKRKDKSND